MAIKDLENTKGLRTTNGSKFFENNIPTADGAVAERVRAAGGVIYGKTNTPNFGHKDMCDNLLGPPTRNPWNLDRTSGASSGGSGAAVAAGMATLAQGSDGAGSIRIPASLCGIFGLKPSFGRVPYWPNVDFWAARSHNGPMTRTVRDSALLLSVIAGTDKRDPASLDMAPIDWFAACDATESLRGMRVAWSPDFGYAAVEPEVAESCARAARRFEELGCHVEEVTPGWDDPRPMAETMWFSTMAARHGDRYRQRPEWFEPSFAKMIEAGLSMSGEDVGKAQMARSAFYEVARTFMDRYDLLLTPQMADVAWPHDQQSPIIAGRSAPGIFDRVPFTFPFNLTGWPAASVPCGFNRDGLPIGLQIVAGWHQDALVMTASAAFEALQPWADRRPSL